MNSARIYYVIYDLDSDIIIDAVRHFHIGTGNLPVNRYIFISVYFFLIYCFGIIHYLDIAYVNNYFVNIYHLRVTHRRRSKASRNVECIKDFP
jgi:hypothetical protein